MTDETRGRPGRPPRSNVPDKEFRACTCPTRNGNIYHQRASCTDRVVAALDWYASDDPAAVELDNYGRVEFGGGSDG